MDSENGLENYHKPSNNTRMSNIKETLKRYDELHEAVSIIKNEINILNLSKEAMEVEMDKIEEVLKRELIGSGRKKAMIAGWKMSLSTSTSTIVEEPDILPQNYWKIEKKPDLTRIKEDFKSGVSVPGAMLQKNTNFNIKKA